MSDKEPQYGVKEFYFIAEDGGNFDGDSFADFYRAKSAAEKRCFDSGELIAVYRCELVGRFACDKPRWVQEEDAK